MVNDEIRVDFAGDVGATTPSQLANLKNDLEVTLGDEMIDFENSRIVDRGGGQYSWLWTLKGFGGTAFSFGALLAFFVIDFFSNGLTGLAAVRIKDTGETEFLEYSAADINNMIDQTCVVQGLTTPQCDAFKNLIDLILGSIRNEAQEKGWLEQTTDLLKTIGWVLLIGAGTYGAITLFQLFRRNR